MLDTTDSTVTAVLGPTNTGKTHYALERMLARRSGIIGLPLRLLAREVYDKLVSLRGPNAVSLITGEEKIWPARATYHVCTVEAMPLSEPVDFVAIDEIQLCADPDRGHVFTDRLLHARGAYETLFLGSDTVRSRIANLVPKARFQRRERFSMLSWAGPKKLSRLKPRTAVVAFSVDQVYAIAELLRRQRGGCAVVMGALSPRTRNAQVALYQDGDVDYLVATDAIGMGLNMDIDHVAFAGLTKFDGRRHRHLEPNELAQIAGRAGRYTKDGSFSTTADASGLDPEVVEAIEGHRFKPVARLMWRNRGLSFATLDALLASLEESPDDPDLVRARDADDQIALRTLAEDAEIRDLASRPDRVAKLWDVCQTPDFRKVSPVDHAQLLSRIYHFLLTGRGCIPSDWLAGQIRRLDRVDGDIDALSKRLAFIRTWTYAANRPGWVEDPEHWRGETRAVEDRLSDALHQRLTQRFVDRRTSVLMRRLKEKERLVADVNDKGEVTAEGQFLGRLDGFRFTVDDDASGDELKTIKSASLAALQSEFQRRADKLYLSPDSEIDITDQGGLMWGQDAIGRVAKGPDVLSPKVVVFVDDMADAQVAEKVERRLTHWLTRKINALFEPMIAMRDDAAIAGLAKGVAFRLTETLGVIPRREIGDDVKALGQEDRAQLRKHGVRFGQHFIFMPALLKPAPTRMRLLLWALAQDLDDFPEAPPPGHVTVLTNGGEPEGYWPMAGYRKLGSRALRIDMLERLADLIRPLDARGGFEATQDMLSITGCTLDQFADLMSGLGFQGERGERPRAPRPKPVEPSETDAADSAAADGAMDSAVAEPSGTAEAGDDVKGEDPVSVAPDGAAAHAASPGDATTSEQEVTSEKAARAASADVSDDDPAAPAPVAGTAEPAAAAASGPESTSDAAQSHTEAIQKPYASHTPAETAAAPDGASDGAAAEAAAGPESTSDAAQSHTEAIQKPYASHTPAETAAEPDGAADGAAAEAGDSAPAASEIEVFYTFRLKPRGRPNHGPRRGRGKPADGARQGDGAAPAAGADGQRPGRQDGEAKEARGRGQRDGQRDGPRQGRRPRPEDGEQPRGKGPKGKGKGKRKPDQDKPRVHQSGPPKREKEVDPDSPFAILKQLKTD